MSKYFFDSYALFEVVYGNEKFIPYAKAGGVTTLFNIAELNYGLKKEKTSTEADGITDEFRASTIKVLWEDIKNAMNLKTKIAICQFPMLLGILLQSASA